MKDILFKLRNERAELTGKIKRLEKFRGTDEWNELSVNHKQLLDIQLSIMKSYLEVLIGRCLDLVSNLPKETNEDKNEDNKDEPVKVVIFSLGE